MVKCVKTPTKRDQKGPLVTPTKGLGTKRTVVQRKRWNEARKQPVVTALSKVAGPYSRRKALYRYVLMRELGRFEKTGGSASF